MVANNTDLPEPGGPITKVLPRSASNKLIYTFI